MAILVVVLAAIRINKRRGQEGREPIRGTAWITPPSYTQSQHNNQQQQPYVPPYSEQANDNDAGYYDNQGNFIPNLKAQEANAASGGLHGNYTGQPQHLNTLVPDQTGLTSPTQTYQPTGQSQYTNDDPQVNFQRDFSRYYGRTSNTNTNANNTGNSSSSPQTDDVELENFSRPDGPPPAHLRGKN